MKKWISLLLAGILVSAVAVGCKKAEEGTTDTASTGGTEGKMESKTDGASTPDAGGGDSKMEGGDTKTDSGDAKMEGGATPPTDGAAAPPAEGESKTGGETK